MVIAALGYLQVGVMARCELHPLGRYQAGEGIVQRGNETVYRRHHRLVIVRTGYRQHLRVSLAHRLFAHSETTGHDHPSVLAQRLPYRLQGLIHRGIDKAAGIDHHQVGILVGGRDEIPFGPKLGEDPLRVDQILGATQTDETDTWRRFVHEQYQGSESNRSHILLLPPIVVRFDSDPVEVTPSDAVHRSSVPSRSFRATAC